MLVVGVKGFIRYLRCNLILVAENSELVDYRVCVLVGAVGSLFE